eukprot:CAMPEP_0204642818 /NCGR_PEP_ID=MMETSP0718-20130828/169_1 /ASSEMBLY_ACC=CAM_ASM_000674 /TAXON_ID=230516 /ORGANISM="Chaetoceros curvisetus" /LENGTH=35 /DNA_ID= /DNA_START= /DNA_END= /DNA_ORIENTATION=
MAAIEGYHGPVMVIGRLPAACGKDSERLVAARRSR